MTAKRIKANGTDTLQLGNGQLSINQSTGEVTVGAPSFAGAHTFNGNLTTLFGLESSVYASSSTSLVSPNGITLVVRNNQTLTGSYAGINLSAQSGNTTNQSYSIGVVSKSSGFSPDLVITRRSGGTAYVEALKIDNTGGVILGPDSGNVGTHIIQNAAPAGAGGTLSVINSQPAITTGSNAILFLNFSGDSTPVAGQYVRFQNLGDSDAGSVSCNGTNAVLFNTSSDSRYKINQRDIAYGLKDILKLRPVHFEWVGGNQPTDIGMIAQEVHPIIPEVVSVPTSDAGKWQMDYSKFSSVLVKAIQELASLRSDDASRIAELAAKLDAAEARIKQLEDR